MPAVSEPRTIKGLDRHSGEWVAIVDDEVVAHAATLSALREQLRAREKHVDRFFRVPPPRRGAGIFL